MKIFSAAGRLGAFFCAAMLGVALCLGLAAARADTGDQGWATYNRTLTSDRYSSLNQISTKNIGSLREACEVNLGDDGGFQVGPVIVDGTMFVTTVDTIVALDAATCAVRWRYVYVPAKPEELRPANRGVAYLDGRIFRGTGDDYLLAVDAHTGKELWRTKIGEASVGEYLSAAPIAWKGLIFLGPAGGDQGIRGRISAFDVATGKQVWRFDTVPMGSEAGANTWHIPETAKHGGGATWTSYTLDPATGELFVSVANPAPDFSPDSRLGDNLYTNSMIVLDAKSGRLKWYYQLDPNDGMDYDLGATAALYTDPHGAARIALGSKDGHLYVLDRATHKLLSKTEVTTVTGGSHRPTPKGISACPGPLGGVEWNGPAYDPATRKIYVGAVDWCAEVTSGPEVWQPGQNFLGTVPIFPTAISKKTGWVTAVDAATGKVSWRYHANSPVLAAVTPTAGGLVFAGDDSGQFLVFDARHGQLLKKQDMGGAMAGGIVTYTVAHKQYVAVAAGNISRVGFSMAKQTPRIIIMTLGLPTNYRPVKLALAPAGLGSVTQPGPGQGRALFATYCATCHGMHGQGGFGPSLTDEGARKKFPQLVAWIQKPMPPMPQLYPSLLSQQDVEAIAHFLLETKP